MPDSQDSSSQRLESHQLVTVESSAIATPEWLEKMAGEIRANLGQAAYNTYLAGLGLRKVRAEVEHGAFGAWVERSFPFSRKTAYQFISVSEFLDDRVPRDIIPKLTASTSVIDTLTRNDLPEDIRSDMTTRLIEGKRLTVDMIKGAAESAARSERRTEYLADVDGRVAALAERVDLDPEVIPVLDEILHREPDTFDEIEASGCIEDAAGEPIPLDEANKRDVRSFIDHTRFERRMVGLARSGAMTLTLQDHRPETNRVVYSRKGLLLDQSFDACRRAVIEAVEGQVGELVGPYEDPVDITFTAYLPNLMKTASELFIRGYESGLYRAGVIAGDGPMFIRSIRVISRRLQNGGQPRFEIDIYPRPVED
jgi:hypothetical protein